ncbi:hypothetical protein Tco_0186354 [Tanacetum coccineum]
MANLSNYGSEVISEVPHFEPYHTDMDNQSVHAMQGFEKTPVADFTYNEITSDNNIIPYYQYFQETQQAAVQDTNLYVQKDSTILSVIEQISEQMINHVNNWEKTNQEKNNESLTVELERYKERIKTFEQRLNIDLITREKMIDSQMDDMIKEKLALNVISGQHVASPVIDDEETLILEEILVNVLFHNKNCLMNKFSGYKLHTLILTNLLRHPVKIEAPKELLKDSLSNNQNALEILEYFENNDLKAQLQAKDTTICKLKEHIKSMREDDKEEKFKHEMDEIETTNIELEHNVAKLLSENERLHKEIEHLKKIYKDQFDSIKKTQKEIVENVAQIPIATTIAPGMFKINLKPLDPRLLNNREAHIDYLKHTQEQANILQGIVEQAKAKQPIDNAIDFACKHAKRIQELLVYVRDTCPNVYKPSEKLIAVTPMNEVNKVRFSEPLTSSSNIQKVESSKTPDSNTPVLSSIGLKCSTSTCRSQPTGNKRNDRILQTPSSNIKNKVEVQHRRVKSKSNKKNRVKDPICDANVKHTMLNANSELIYVKCNQCMFDANQDVCFLDFVIYVNVRSKSKITPKKIVHLKETTSISVETPKPEIKVYSRRPKQIKSVGSSKKAKIVESKIANNSKPNHLWGSNATDVPSSSSLVNDMLSRLSSGIWTPDAQNI